MNSIADHLGCIPPGWETRAIVVDGVYYGDVMLRGNEVHVATVRGMSRRSIRAFAADLLAEKFFLVTRSQVGDASEAFIRRLGFVQTNEDTEFCYWWLDQLPFNKRNHHE